MRFSLCFSTNAVSGAMRSHRYTLLEQHVIAAELFGFSAIWIDSSEAGAPFYGSSTVRLLQQLSVATDRIDLGIVAQLPEPAARARFLDDVRRLDDLAGGRVRLTFHAANQPTATIAFAEDVAARLHMQYMPWLARRVHIRAEDATVTKAGSHGLGLLMPATDDSAHTRSLHLARYHDARGAQPGWVTRQRTVVLAASEAATDALTRHLTSDVLRAKHGSEAPLIGTVAQVISQLAVLQMADGIDELVCNLVPSDLHSDSMLRAIELFGREVTPHFVGHELPRPSVPNVSIPSHRGDARLVRAAAARRTRQRMN